MQRLESMSHIPTSKAFKARLAIFNDNGSDSAELYDAAASLVPIGAWSCDLRTDALSWTAGVFDIFGLSREQVPDRRAAIELYSGESAELLERKRAHAIEICSGFSLDVSIVRPDGIERWVRITAATRSANGRAETLYGMKQDITEDHARWEQLRAQAERDPLTGVANRARFQRFLEQPSADPTLDRIGALLLFDMNGFKQLNDWWGHAAGDACLAAFGERLRKSFPHAHLVSRIGGDEFAVLLPSMRSRAETQAQVQSLMGNLLRPVSWNGDLLPLSASVGLAFASNDPGFDPQTLFVAADRALYNAKENASSAVVCA